MKKYILFAIGLPLLLSGFFSCTNSHEDDIIYYIPKQVREITTNGENKKEVTTYSLTYANDGRILSESDGNYTADIHHNNDILIDSVRVTYKSGTTDSLHRIFTHNESDIDIRQVIFVKEQPVATVFGTITLNADRLPLTYALNNTEERYTYNSEGKLTTIERYENSVLKWTRTYEYQDHKSPYDEVIYFPAWYFVVYRHMSPVGFAVKATYQEGGSAPVVEYEMSDIVLSDLGFVTKCIKTYDDGGETKVVTYRQDYRKLVFD